MKPLNHHGSIAQIHIHEFESELEWAYYELLGSMGAEALTSMVESFEPEILGWREFCLPGTSDVEHAFLVLLSDKLDGDSTPEEQLQLRKVIQATLQHMRIKGTLV